MLVLYMQVEVPQGFHGPCRAQAQALLMATRRAVPIISLTQSSSFKCRNVNLSQCTIHPFMGKVMYPPHQLFWVRSRVIGGSKGRGGGVGCDKPCLGTRGTHGGAAPLAAPSCLHTLEHFLLQPPRDGSAYRVGLATRGVGPAVGFPASERLQQCAYKAVNNNTELHIKR